jgi:hypothetical protein
VVRAEIRKAAAARKTDLPAARLPTLMGQLRPAEKGVLWAIIHDPEHIVPALLSLEDEDLEGLSAAGILRIARELAVGPARDVPNALMERLNVTEAQWLAAIASESSAPVLDAESSVRSIKRLRIARELSAVQREIGRLQEQGEKGSDFMALLHKKLELGRLLTPENN